MAVETEKTRLHQLDLIDRDLIRGCVHCGMCLSYCPTYKELGSELDSPRGRIYQMKLVTDGRVSVDSPDFREHINLCLNCRACETACPSGVQYGQLLEQSRAIIPPASRLERVLRFVVLNKIFTSSTLLRLFGAATRFYQKTGLQSLARHTGLIDRMPLNIGRLERLLPRFQGGVFNGLLPEFTPAVGPRKHRVAFIAGCVQDEIFRRTNASTISVLARNGCEVIVPTGQACCGALHVHGGETGTAQQLARRNIEVFEKLDVEAVIVNAAGCGSTLKEYFHLLHDDPEYYERAKSFSQRMRDVNEFLGAIDLNCDLGEIRRRVTYQDACHLVHGQKVSEQPRDLINSIPGIEFVELGESDACCGSAGIYNITNYDMSMEILDRKLDFLAETGAEILVASNTGCIIQLAHGVRKRGLPIEVMHPIDLLDWSYRTFRSKTGSKSK